SSAWGKRRHRPSRRRLTQADIRLFTQSRRRQAARAVTWTSLKCARRTAPLSPAAFTGALPSRTPLAICDLRLSFFNLFMHPLVAFPWRVAPRPGRPYNSPDLLTAGRVGSATPSKGSLSMPKVVFVNEKTEIEVPQGANLRAEARKAGIDVYAGLSRYLNCLGNGLCGTCRVL